MTEIDGVLNYDGRYDGPEFTHPFWPRVAYPPVNAASGHMQTCAVCGLLRDGTALTGDPFDDSRGNPHQTMHGWPFTVLVQPQGHRLAGELAITCPECGSFDVTRGILPGGIGTGPGGRWRLGDPGGGHYIRCNTCQHQTTY